MSKRYTIECKKQATKLVLEHGMSANQASKDLGVSQAALSRWVRDEKSRRLNPELPTLDQAAEIKRLRKENALLKRQRDILKDATVFFARGYYASLLARSA